MPFSNRTRSTIKIGINQFKNLLKWEEYLKEGIAEKTNNNIEIDIQALEKKHNGKDCISILVDEFGVKPDEIKGTLNVNLRNVKNYWNISNYMENDIVTVTRAGSLGGGSHHKLKPIGKVEFDLKKLREKFGNKDFLMKLSKDLSITNIKEDIPLTRKQKIKLYSNYNNITNQSEKKEVAKRAYASAVKATMIGSLASGSRPFVKERLPTRELAERGESLARKHKANPNKTHYKTIQSNQPMRLKYGGKDNVQRGFLYSHLRLEKYKKRQGMESAILDGIKLKLDHNLDEKIDLSTLLKEARIKLEKAISGLSNKQAMSYCLKGLINSYLEKSNLSNLKKYKDIMPELISILETVDVLNKIGKSEFDLSEKLTVNEEIRNLYNRIDRLSNSRKDQLSVGEYTKAMSLMNLAVMNQINNGNMLGERDTFYEKMTNTKQPPERKTLVSNGGRAALDRSLKVLLSNYQEKTRFPGFELQGAGKNDVCRGYFEWSNNQEVTNKDQVALFGRDSETKYHLNKNSKDFKSQLETMKIWATTPPHPKTLIVDVTIPTNDKTDPILTSVLKLRNELEKEQKGNFDVLVVRSEQKQQSLGTGKFAAGSSFLITNNIERQMKFNEEAVKERTPDQQLATFYRENLSNEVQKLVKKQCEVARKTVKQNMRKDLDIISNGPFVSVTGLGVSVGPSVGVEDHDRGYSFGFVETNYSSWVVGQKRMDPGLKGPQR